MKIWKHTLLAAILCLSLSTSVLAAPRDHATHDPSAPQPSISERLAAALEKADFSEQQGAVIREKIEALKAVQAEGKALHEATKQQGETNRNLIESLKGRADAKALRKQIAPLREELVALREAVQQAHQERREAALAVRKAIKAGDFGQVVSGLERLVQIQKEHNQTLSEVLSLAQQVGAILAQ